MHNYGEHSSLIVRMRLREFTIPPIRDALVIGTNAPIGGEAMRRALKLLHVAPFNSIKVNDDVIDEILVRDGLLRKINIDALKTLVMSRVRPFMSNEEVIHIDLDVELVIEEKI